MSEIQRLPALNNPIHPNAKATQQITNGTTTTKSNMSSPVCRNCKTQTTPLWRRDETGQVLCNACGLFLKLHGRPRPISLKTDTIKLRNRIKQPNFSKTLGPNTPELKLKDSKNGVSLLLKDSPKNAKKRSGNNSPLDSVYGSGQLKPMPSSGPSLGIQSPLQHNQTRVHYPGSTMSQHLGRLPGSFHQQVQLLNYPSSTPTQFAPGLQRITSPLLLSTTLSMLNARLTQASNSTVSLKSAGSASVMVTPFEPLSGALTDAQAAGALENMSNELGPSASFKSGSSSNLERLSLIAPTGRKPQLETSSLSTPSSALNQAVPPHNFPTLNGGRDSLKSNGNVIVSPSFGPQFHLQENSVKLEPMDHPKPSLPPISSLTSRSPASLPLLSAASLSSTLPGTPDRSTFVSVKDQLAPMHTKPVESVLSTASASYTRGASSGDAPASSTSNAGFSGAPSNSLTSISQQQTGQVPSNAAPGNSQGNGDHNNNNNNNSNNGSNNGATNNNYQLSLLKTRILELELVNDLYRTRIMELEAMEQAARLREQSIRKRLDDFLQEQGQMGPTYVSNDTMNVLKREGDVPEESAKKQKTT